MDTMEAILIAVLFLIPGSFVNIIMDRFFPKSTKEKSDFEKTIYSVIYSSIIIFINILFMRIIKNMNINTFEELQIKLRNIKYIGLTMLSSTLFVIAKQLYEKIELWIVNKIRQSNNLATESKFETVWDEIFENKAIDLTDTYITIMKDGQVISHGCLKRHSPPSLDNKELLLVATKEFERFLNHDKMLEDDEKLLDIIDKEYYNLNNGVLIKFYNNTKLLNYLNE